MHKTGSITTLVLLALTPTAVGAQRDTSSAQRAAVTAKTEPAAVLASVSEVAKWIAFAVIGIYFSKAWQKVRETERKESEERTQREATKDLWKELLRPAETEKNLQELVTRIENAADQIAVFSSRADATLSQISDRLLETSQQMIKIQEKLDRGTSPETLTGPPGSRQ